MACIHFHLSHASCYCNSQNCRSLGPRLRNMETFLIQRWYPLPPHLHRPVEQEMGLLVRSKCRVRSAYSNGKDLRRSVASMLTGLTMYPLCIADWAKWGLTFSLIHAVDHIWCSTAPFVRGGKGFVVFRLHWVRGIWNYWSGHTSEFFEVVVVETIILRLEVRWNMRQMQIYYI